LISHQEVEAMGQARETVERFYERFAAGDLDGAVELFSSDCRHVGPGMEQNADEWKAFSGAFKSALPDAHMELVQIVETDDVVAVEARFKGTFSNPLATPQGELPPTGNAIDVRFADFFRFRDGTIVEHRVYWDQVDMMGQLGVGSPAGA